MVAARWAARWAGAACLVLLACMSGGCAVGSYEPLVVTPERGLPEDAWKRCHALMSARYQRLLVVDEAGFRLQTDWVAGPEPDVASQQRATVFRDGAAVACVVEARYLQFGWFDSVPAWSSPRPDVALERELGAALGQALASASPSRSSAGR